MKTIKSESYPFLVLFPFCSNSFTYNDEGIRTSKTKNGVKTTYYLSGSQIVAEETSNNITLYIYDSQGSPIGMQYHGASYAADAWDTFWFEKNLQGDIVAVYGGDGTKYVYYKYDAWGSHNVTYYNGGEDTAAANNPFRYRGYYYDSDLALYCVGTRYYDSVICRWINADSALYHNMFGYNMYTYCNNNPVNYYDPTGESAAELLVAWLTGAGTTAVIEPTIIGEVVLVIGLVVIGGIVLGEAIADGILSVADAVENADDTPKSITEPSNIPEGVEIPDVEYPGDDPTVAPDGYEWTGPDPQGGNRGGYKNKNPQKRDSWHPDLKHPDNIGPHWDYNDIFKHKWRVFPDHIEFVY